ncbi:LPD23 domain-containing protein [Methylobacterium gossipiicola]|nr:LPD23 domain-containing protein [Methylobacterium gossipiicola]
MGAAAGIAGTAMTGSLPFGAPKGALRMFGGWNAETADHAALSKAQNLKATGADRQAIWDQTGWFQAPDNYWRFEIPDDLATLGTPKNAPPGYSRLYHDDLGDAYPELWGSTQQSIRESPVMAGRYEAQDGVIHAQGPTAADQRSVALHELQHAIQSQEGFARGANPRSFTATDWEAAGLPMLSESKNAAQAHERWARDQYHRTAGEVEARNVQTRRDFTPEQRRAIPPWETQDVPDAQQIVRPSDTALFSGGRGGVAPAAAAMARPEAPSNTQDPPMSAGIPYGLPTDMSPADLARFFGRAPMGAPQAFTGTSGTVVPPEAQAGPMPLSLRVPPRASAPTAPDLDRGAPASPDFQSAQPSAGGQPPRMADMPAPGAVPTSGKFPGLASPAPTQPAASSVSAGGEDGFDLGGALKSFQANGGGDLLVGLGTGLMSTHGLGNGLAVGFQNAQKAEQQRAVTGLAQAELGLKQRKLAQETGALAGNAAIIKRAFPNLSDAEAAAAGSNSGQVTEALKILRDPTHGRDIKTDSSGVNRFIDTGKPIFADDEGKADWQQAKTPDGGTILYSKSDPSKTQVLVPGQPVRPATTEERAMFGIPSNVPVKMTPTGPQAIGGGGTSVNVDLGKKANQGLDELTNAKISESYDKSQGAIGTLKAISRQKQAIDGGMITGWGADYQTQARSLLAKVLGLDPASVVNSETFDAAASQKGAELAKAISQAGHTTNMDLQLGKTIAGGDRSKIEQSIRNAIEAQEQLARDTIAHHNEFLNKYAKVAPDTADRLGVFRVDTPETYQYRPAAPDRAAVEAELRRRKVIK